MCEKHLSKAIDLSIPCSYALNFAIVCTIIIQTFMY